MASAGAIKSRGSGQTNMGKLKVFPLEIRFEIYKFALPTRMIRFYPDSQEKQHVFVEALTAPDLALFCPYADALFFDLDIAWAMPRQIQGRLISAISGEDINPSQSTKRAVAKPNSDLQTWEVILAGIAPFTKKANTVVVDWFYGVPFLLAMNTSLFPSLKTVLIASGPIYDVDETIWANSVATVTQANRAIVAGQQPRSVTLKCRPLCPSKLQYDPRYKRNVPLDDRGIQYTWNEIPPRLSTFDLQPGQMGHENRMMIERHAAMNQLYWDTGYEEDQNGNRLYKSYWEWKKDISPSSSEVIVRISSLPELIPVRLFYAIRGYPGSLD